METFIMHTAQRVMEQISSMAVLEIKLGWKAKEDMKDLKNTLSTIQKVLLDAEEQQVKNHSVRDWLEKLKDAVYDIEDMLDDFSTEASRQKVEIHGSKLKQIGNFFSQSNPLAFDMRMGHRIKDVKKRLEDIAADKRNFSLTQKAVTSGAETSARKETYSLVNVSDIIGREDDKEEIVKLLMSSSNGQNVSVIPIVGIGGLGKTALAKLVYNDQRVDTSFELKMWVHVPENFDLKKLTERILNSATNGNWSHLGMEQLQTNLRAKLNNTKFLLVLDDVWKEDWKDWEELSNLLNNGASGSKIIVTTRSQKIASITGTIDPFYSLKCLPHEPCFALFLKCAFKEGEENRHPKLVDIGKEIVSKCGGVPLAVKSLGGLLQTKSREADWLNIRDNDIWKLQQKENDILPVLRLSYDDVPSHIKQCFAYCSVFPKDFEIWRPDLINQWNAQGLIQPSSTSQSPVKCTTCCMI